MQEIVKIHGNWCGPDWTAGQKKPAKDLIPSDRSVPCLDKLDCAAKIHDMSQNGGRTRRRILLSFEQPSIAYDLHLDHFSRKGSSCCVMAMLLGASSKEISDQYSGEKWITSHHVHA